jgi:ferrous iron transport protein A
LDLSSLKFGEKATFIGVHGGWGMARRLEAMGIRPGVTLTKLSNQFMRGPVIVQAGRTQLAIGYHMARRMMVEKLEKEGP